ncbi:unnamed protein product [Adineta ricciae]|uniref:ILEI/PANDER domain-containing protein n=1 Tax=Adineta ricciae TaxID=249248 RepID=A0A814IHE0_ADIRI|nr:unnamed protein product [Adineta ricciae]
MRKIKRLLHKIFGGVGNFFAIIILVSITVIFVNTYVLSARESSGALRVIDSQEFSLGSNETRQSSMQAISRSTIVDPGCEINEKCSRDSFAFKITSGDGLNKYPSICFNNKLLLDKNLKDSKVGRGLNIVVINSTTFDVKLIETFDTYLEETFFLRALRLNLTDGDIVIMASFDEMTSGLREASITLLEKYGSQAIKGVKYRDSFVMLGQKGIPRGKAIEMHVKKGSREYAAAAHISGCATFPLGQITPLVLPNVEIYRQGNITIGTSIENCGLAEVCKSDEFAVHLYTGKDNNDEPKICVNGHYVISKGINNAGRGLNIAVVSHNKEVIRIGHFDTWQDDSTNLEIFLENLEDDAIIIVVTFDEASSKLSQHSKNLFFDLGSATIQNLKYRDVWVLVGQKGINGFSPFEEISYAGTGFTYAPAIDKKICVPKKLRGQPIRPDPIPYHNDRRREFCSHYEDYGDFCSETNVDKSLSAVPLLNRTLEDNSIYSTPILVIAGTSNNALRMCLETILMQPGVNAENVIVAIDEKSTELFALVQLFGFKNLSLPTTTDYMEFYEKALKETWNLYPKSGKLIVIEENLLLSPDFLYTLALLSEVFRKDATIGAIQMWNPNSFDIVNGSIELIYRVDDFYGLGFLVKRSFYDRYIKDSFKQCCSKRVWEKWTFSDLPTSFLMPDISRVFRRPFDENQSNRQKSIETLFNEKRRTNLDPFPPLSNIDTLRQNKYDETIKTSLSSATLLKSLDKCTSINTYMYNLIQNQNISHIFKHVYSQQSVTDVSSLLPVLPCFGLLPHEVFGLYHGVLRFSSNNNSFYLVGSKSPLLNTKS